MAVQSAVLVEVRELLGGATPSVERLNTHGPPLLGAGDLLDWDAYAADEDVDGDDEISDDEDEEVTIVANEPWHWHNGKFLPQQVTDYIAFASCRLLQTQIEVSHEARWVSPADVVARLGAPIFVITAANPRSCVLDSAENVLRNEELLDDLVQTSKVSRIAPAVGRSPDGAWEEHGFAVWGIGRRRARALGRRYGQHAIFEITRREVRVWGCASDWKLARPLQGGAVAPEPESELDLQAAICAALGVVVPVAFRRSRRRGWVHEPGVGLACRSCGGDLELFGAELRASSGDPYRATVFVCADERLVLLPHAVPEAFRTAARARQEFLLAQQDANDAGASGRKYWAYCIELDEVVGEREGDHPWIYVGQSSRTPEERFAQHLSRHKASRVVRDHGVRLRPDLYANQPMLRTKAEALTYERWLYEKLRVDGWPVRGGT